MNSISSHSFAPQSVRPAARPAVSASVAAPLTSAEEARIADSFPARPKVAQKLYGPGRQVQHAPEVGTRLDLSA